MKRVSGVWFTILLLAATGSTLSAQQGIYMLVDPIVGDQVQIPHKGEFKLNSFSFSVVNTSTPISGSLSVGKATFQGVKVSMRLHGASVATFSKNLIAGTKLTAIEIRHYNATNVMVYKTVFEGLLLTNVAMEGSDETVEQLEFIYSRMKWFAPPDPAGLQPPAQLGCWDVLLNRAC